MSTHKCALLVAGLLVVAAAAHASVTYRAASTILVGAASSNVLFGAGPGAMKDRYVTAFAVSVNGTSFTGTFTGRAGADVTVKKVAYLNNTGTVSRSVTLSGPQVTNAQVVIFTWEVKEGTHSLGKIDYSDANPSITFTLPAGEAFRSTSGSSSRAAPAAMTRACPSGSGSGSRESRLRVPCRPPPHR